MGPLPPPTHPIIAPLGQPAFPITSPHQPVSYFSNGTTFYSTGHTMPHIEATRVANDPHLTVTDLANLLAPMKSFLLPEWKLSKI